MKQTTKGWWSNPSNLSLAVFLAIGGYFLWTEHKAHIIAALPWVLAGSCVVMHLLMHGSHGHGGDGHRGDGANKGDNEP